MQHLQRTPPAGAGHHRTSILPFSGGIPLRFALPLDQFPVLAHPDILARGRIRFSFAWIGLNPPNGDDTVRLLPDTEHIRIRSHRQIPDDHLRTEPYVVRSLVNGRPCDRILAVLQAEYGIPDWMIDYREDSLGYEATIHLPVAQTITYDALRRELTPVRA